jgi:hypothetical protein
MNSLVFTLATAVTLLLVPSICMGVFPLLSAYEGDEEIRLEWTLEGEPEIDSLGGYYVYRDAGTTSGDVWVLIDTLEYRPADTVRAWTYADSPLPNGYGFKYAVTYYIYENGQPSEVSSIEDNNTRMLYPHFCVGAPALTYEEDHNMVTLTWSMSGACDASADFGGYRVWRDDVGTAGEEFAIVAEFDRRKGTWVFDRWITDSLRTFVDDHVHDGFPYRYAVTYYFYDGSTEVPMSDVMDNVTETVYPEGGSKERPLYQVYAVPNPYLGSASWDEGDERKIQFVNLPADAIVRIFTSSGSLVRTLRNVTPSGGPNDDSNRVDWDLLNENGDRVAPDIYIFAVESEKWGDEIGRVVVVK